MADKEFFDESTEQSQVKSAIVHDYFLEWSRVNAVHLRTRFPSG